MSVPPALHVVLRPILPENNFQILGLGCIREQESKHEILSTRRMQEHGEDQQACGMALEGNRELCQTYASKRRQTTRTAPRAHQRCSKDRTRKEGLHG